MNVLGGADKSLARPGRKQPTANKLGIYSKFSSRSPINFLDRCCNFCKTLKEIQKIVHSTRCPRQQWSPRRKKNWENSIVFFSVQRTGSSPMGPDPKNRLGDTLEAQVGQFLMGCKWLVSQGIVVREQDLFGDLPMVFFLQNVLHLHQQRWVILCVDSLALWKIINEEDAISIPKNQGENFSSRYLHSEFFGARWVAMPPLHWLLLCLRVILI